jgi:hypothetical protein
LATDFDRRVPVAGVVGRSCLGLRPCLDIAVAASGVDTAVAFDVGTADPAFEVGTADPASEEGIVEPERGIAALAFEADIDFVSALGPTAQKESSPVQSGRVFLHLPQQKLGYSDLEVEHSLVEEHCSSWQCCGFCCVLG